MPASYFDDLYRENHDPWDFESSRYENGKYAATLAALPKKRYREALEIGCSIGVLTRMLAARCDQLTAIDAAELALAIAKERCHDLQHVRFAAMAVPTAFPSGQFDLIVLSEILYYMDIEDLQILAGKCEDALSADGYMILVHWTRPTNYPLSGDQAAEGFSKAMRRVRLLHQDRTEQYRIDVVGSSRP